MISIFQAGDYDAHIRRAAEILQAGGLVVLPTETVYGVAAILTQPKAIARLRALRPALGPGRVLSLSAVRPAPFSLPLAPNFVWSPAYYARVAAEADQIVIMAYDTALPTPALYRRYVAWATSSVTGALALSRSYQVLG